MSASERARVTAARARRAFHQATPGVAWPRAWPLAGVVEGEEGDRQPVRMDDPRRVGRLGGAAGADHAEPGGAERPHRVRNGGGACVSGVVVRDRHRIEPGRREDPRRGRPRLESIRPVACTMGPVRKRGLEVRDREVGRPELEPDSGEDGVRVPGRETGEAAAEHHVAAEDDSHRRAGWPGRGARGRETENERCEDQRAESHRRILALRSALGEREAAVPPRRHEVVLAVRGA